MPSHHTDDELVHDHISRLTKLEETVKNHGESLATLVPSVTAIENHLKAIKWICFGALGLYMVQKYGLLCTLEKMFKIT